MAYGDWEGLVYPGPKGSQTRLDHIPYSWIKIRLSVMCEEVPNSAVLTKFEIPLRSMSACKKMVVAAVILGMTGDEGKWRKSPGE